MGFASNRTIGAGALVLGIYCLHARGEAPGDILDLAGWKLTLPIAKDGSDGASKIAAEIAQPTLATYAIDPWFRSGSLAGKPAILFRAHANGAKTSSHTKFARSELREMTLPGYTSAAWKFGDGKYHTMVLTEAVTALPLQHPQTAAGQIHDADNDVFMLKCEGAAAGKAKLVGYVDNASKGFPLDEAYAPGTFFTLKVEVGPAGGLSVWYNGKATPITGYTSFPVVKAAGDADLSGMYFKAGCYIQSNVVDYGEDPDAFAEVAIASLQVTHGLPVDVAMPAPKSAPSRGATIARLVDFLGRRFRSR